MSLPPFDPAKEVLPNDGHEDKIKLTFGNWYVRLPAKNHDEALHKIGLLRQALMGGKLFSVVNHADLRQPIPIRSSKGKFVTEFHEDEDVRQEPLFGGMLETRLLYPGKNSPQVVKASGSRMVQFSFVPLFLNPMRFVRHQALPSPESPQKWGKAKWSKATLGPKSNGEFSLTGEDNWIPAGPEWTDFVGGASWQRHLRRYLKKVRDVFTDELCTARDSVNEEHDLGFGDVIEYQTYAVQEVETAWEFVDDDPLERVRSLSRRIFDLGQRETTTSVHEGVLNLMAREGYETRQFNSFGLKITLRNGFDLRVYAKTNRRVRFEIIQDTTRKRKALLNAAKVWHEAMKENKNHSQISHLLKMARVAAATMLNSIVLPSLNSVPDLRIRQRSVCTLLADFAAVCGTSKNLRAVLSMLISNGAIHTGVKGKPMSPELRLIRDRLKKAGLVELDPKSLGFQVAPRYRWALNQMRGAEAEWIMMTSPPPPRVRD